MLGRVTSLLASGGVCLLDEQNSFDVTLVDADQWLTSCDDEALAAGENLAAVGEELLQFGKATALGNGRFRLSRLLRGRGGTEWACSGHSSGELFCLVQPGAVQRIDLPAWSVGASIGVNAPGGAVASVAFAAEALRPPSPVNLKGDRSDAGDLVLSWTRRSRQGFAWIDGVDAPLGETDERYAISIEGAAGSVESMAVSPCLVVPAAEVATLGTGPATVSVRQNGDFAASRPAQLAIIIS